MLILFTIFQLWAFVRLRVTCGIKRRTQKLGQHILLYVSKFPHSDLIINLLLEKNISGKHFEKTNRSVLRIVYLLFVFTTIIAYTQGVNYLFISSLLPLFSISGKHINYILLTLFIRLVGLVNKISHNLIYKQFTKQSRECEHFHLTWMVIIAV